MTVPPLAMLWRFALLAAAAGALLHSLLAADVPNQPDPVADAYTEAAVRLRQPTPDLARTPDIVSRPIFHASRQPFAPPAPVSPEVAASAPAAPPAQWALTGTVLQHGRTAAILRSPSSSAALVLHEGDPLEGWTLQTIRHDRLTFARGSQSWELGFRKAP
jgi:opacity protein-like surface antigen